MEPSNRRACRNEEIEEGNNDLDRLSSLPDSVLIHMLSYLDTKTSIQMSVLSKRYRSLWTLSQCLDFKLCQFHSDGFESRDGCVFPRVKNSIFSFERFVNRVLRNREDSNLTVFRLSLHELVSQEFLQNCIHYAAEHKVQHLMVRGCVKRKPVTLPKALLMSTSLVTLNLNNAINFGIELPKSVSLPNLKALRLKKFEFSDRNYNGELFTGCPNLETLVLTKCWIRVGNELKVLDVNCLNLKNLEIRYWRSPWRCFDEQMINVSAPQLDYFKFQGHLARVNFKDGLPCLDKACIDLSYPTSCVVANAFERKQRTSEIFLNMLRVMSNVKFLELSLRITEILWAVPDLPLQLFTVFENLRFLKFTDGNKSNVMTIPVETVIRTLKTFACGMLLFHGSKELKVSPARSSCKHRDSRHVTIPSNIMRLLLEICPSAEVLSIEMPKSHQTKYEAGKWSHVRGSVLSSDRGEGIF